VLSARFEFPYFYAVPLNGGGVALAQSKDSIINLFSVRKTLRRSAESFMWGRAIGQMS
jgi:hypothetical protein